MSPEPIQEPMEQNLSAPNVTNTARANTVRADPDDNRVEHAMTEGYTLLFDIPNDDDSLPYEYDDFEDEEWISMSGGRSPVLSITPPGEQQEDASETIEVWTSLCNRPNIELDPDKINQVKSMMANFTLPVTAIPEWANSISEEQWKEQLIDRIKEMRNREAQAASTKMESSNK